MKKVKIVEVGLRDGLQNEAKLVSAEVRIEAGRKLIATGIQHLELGSFVRADRIPQMANSKEVIEALSNEFRSQLSKKKLSFSALVPNEHGMNDAIESSVMEIAIFGAASESFSKKNINCTIDESFERFIPVVKLAKKHKIRIRGYLSTCFDCPYEGPIAESAVMMVAKRMAEFGCYEISVGDTIGVATPNRVESLFKKLKRIIPSKKLAGHFHDTRGTALANIMAAYKLGITTFDTSLGGLGGCPYAPGAAGNVATEDVVYLFEGLKVKTGINLEKLIEVNRWMGLQIGKTLPSKVGQAGLPLAKGKI